MACSANRKLYTRGVLKKPVKVEYASEFRYRNKHLDSDSLVIAISQSGETADTLSSIKKAKEYKIDISNLLGRQINKEDLDSFDLIYVMDKSNYSNVMELAVNEKQKEKIKLILNESEPNKNLEVPDPYWSSDDGFENVYQMLNKACIEIIRKYA